MTVVLFLGSVVEVAVVVVMYGDDTWLVRPWASVAQVPLVTTKQAVYNTDRVGMCLENLAICTAND